MIAVNAVTALAGARTNDDHRAVNVTNADRVVFPDVGKTKGDVVAYYERIADRMLTHVIDRPLSLKRYPKGLSGPGFFQKNAPAHYPPSIGRFPVPRSPGATKKHPKAEADVTTYPLVRTADHLAFLANQNAIELHVPTARAPDVWHPDRVIVDLDPPAGAVAEVRRAAHVVREELGALGLPTLPVATGSKGYHVVARIVPNVDADAVLFGMQKVTAWLAAKHEALTVVFRVGLRGKRVFLDWLRNGALATVVAPYSLRARPRATVAVPLTWDELDTHPPDAFTIDDAARLAEREDPLAAMPEHDATGFFRAVDEAFDASGLVLEAFDRFRS
jgi:bifunctional non-homologous end joining protein LigD